MTLERAYTCACYTTGSRTHPPEAAPDFYWRKIVLAYTNRAVSVLVYQNEPADPEEIPDLMRRLEGRAATSGYTITVMDGVKEP